MSYRVTEESTGELLAEFNPAEFEKGANGALYAAARYATRQAKDEGRAVLLDGPEAFTRRRYAPEYVGGAWRAYRVPCAVEECPNWIHPVSAARSEGATCREHYAASEELREKAARMREARWPEREE